MPIDRRAFFDAARKQFGALTQSRVEGFNTILDEWEKRKLKDLRWLAYILGTAWHETGRAMQPVIETRGGRDKENPSVDEAIRRLESAFAKGRMPWVKRPYWAKNAEGHSYLGRGYPQLTHEENYAKMGKILGIDLVAHPEMALETEHAVQIMFEGMLRGSFTGKKLADYFGPGKDNAREARRIINGMESTDKVKAHYDGFLAVLKAAEEGAPVAGPVSPVPTWTPEPEDTDMISEDNLAPEEVMTIQAQLRNLGWAQVGKVDGIWGASTRGALAALQAQAGIDPVDGHWNAETREALFVTKVVRPISTERANTTAEDLREQGSVVVRRADKIDLAQWGQLASTVLMVLGAAASATASGQADLPFGVGTLISLIPQPYGTIIGAVGGFAFTVYTKLKAKGVIQARVESERTGVHNGEPMPSSGIDLSGLLSGLSTLKQRANTAKARLR